MTTSERATVNTRNPSSTIGSYLGNRWVLVGMATAAITGGLALNWGWLVAIGVAPILVGLLPCLVMCGLGLCANKMFGSSCASQQAPSQDAKTATPLSVSSQAGTATKDPLAAVSSCCGTDAVAQSAADSGQSQTPNERRVPHA